MRTFFAIVHKDAESSYGASFPDLPGCFSAADDEHDIYPNAQQAVSLYMADIDEIPQARSIAALMSMPDVRKEIASGAFLIAIPLITSMRKERYNVMLEPSIAETLNVVAKASGVSRSEYISDAIVAKLISQQHAIKPLALAKGMKIGGHNSTGSQVASAAAKVMASKTASKQEKSVAASALTQKGSTEQTGAKVASSAGKILKSKTASKSAKSAAASALSQKTKKRA